MKYVDIFIMIIAISLVFAAVGVLQSYKVDKRLEALEKALLIEDMSK